MKKKHAIALIVLIPLFSIALIAQAKNFKQEGFGTNKLSFDPQNRAYRLTSTTPFLSQPIEQRYLTIKSINTFEAHLEKNGSTNSN